MSGCWLKGVGRVLLFSGGMAMPCVAQSASPIGLQAVPTTKVLAIGHITSGATGAALRPVMPSEVRETVKLYLAGKIDQWYVRKDTNGVVFLMNVTTVEEAHGLLEELPLGVAKLMEFDLIPVGPLSPLAMLLGQPGAATPAPATPTPTGK